MMWKSRSGLGLGPTATVLDSECAVPWCWVSAGNSSLGAGCTWSPSSPPDRTSRAWCRRRTDHPRDALRGASADGLVGDRLVGVHELGVAAKHAAQGVAAVGGPQLLVDAMKGL